MTVPVGVQCERDDARRDAQAVCAEYGTPCTFRVRQESNVSRDAYGSVKERPTVVESVSIGAYPFTSNPSQRAIESAGLAGLKEGIDAIAYTAALDWTTEGYTFDQLDCERMTVLAVGREWRIVGKGEANTFSDLPLHFTFALKRP